MFFFEGIAIMGTCNGIVEKHWPGLELCQWMDPQSLQWLPEAAAHRTPKAATRTCGSCCAQLTGCEEG